MNIIKNKLLYLFIIGGFLFTPSFTQDLKAENNNTKVTNSEIAGISVRFGHGGRHHRGYGHRRFGYGRHHFGNRYWGYPRYNRYYYGPRYRSYYSDPYYYYGRPGGVYFNWRIR